MTCGVRMLFFQKPQSFHQTVFHSPQLTVIFSQPQLTTTSFAKVTAQSNTLYIFGGHVKKKVYVFASAVIYVSSEGASKVLVGRACIIRPPNSVS